MASRKRQEESQVSIAEQSVRKSTLLLKQQSKGTKARATDAQETRPSKSRASTRRSVSNRKSDFSYHVDSGDSEDDDDSDNRLQIAWEGETSETQSTHSEEGSESSGAASNGSARPKATMAAASSMVRHPLSRWNALITLQNREIPLVYHKNMARTFPGAARTPEQLEMRRRNTEAARVSRAKAKLAEMLMEREASELSATNEAVKRMVASQLVYANALCKMLDMPPVQLTTFKRIGQAVDEEMV